MKRVKLKISNKAAYTILAILIVIFAGFGVYAYNSGGPPYIVGHSSGEIDFSGTIPMENVQVSGYITAPVGDNVVIKLPAA